MSQNEIARCKCGYAVFVRDVTVGSDIGPFQIRCICGRSSTVEETEELTIRSHNDDQRTWIKCSERMPTQEDKDNHNGVLWRVKELTMLGHWTGKDVDEPQELKKFGKWMHLPPNPEED